MKKTFFNAIIVSSLLLLAGGGLFLSKGLQNTTVKEVKADTVEVTLNPTGNFADNGDKNTIDLECTPETDIPTGWDAGALIQDSRDAVIINGEYLQDKGGNITMRKQGAYRYTVCIDSIWKFHDIIQDNDIVVLGGKWAQEGFDVTLTPICVQWSEASSKWTKLDSYDIGTVSLSVKDSRKNNQNELYLDASGYENFLPADGGWGMRMNQGSNDAFIFNGDETKPVTGRTVQLMKVRYDMYLVYIPDVGEPYNSVSAGDIIVIQGIYVYQYSPRFVTHLHVSATSVAWDGTQWVDAGEYYSEHFLEAPLCDWGENAPSSTLWANLATTFGYLGSDAATKFKNASYTINGNSVTPGAGVSQEMAEAAARYDYIITKYGSEAYNDFANRFNGAIVPPASNVFELSVNNNYVEIIVVCFAFIAASSTALFFIIRRRRRVTK